VPHVGLALSLPHPWQGKYFPCHSQREIGRKAVITNAVFGAFQVPLGLRGDFSCKIPDAAGKIAPQA
jgi:hypothetical protein